MINNRPQNDIDSIKVIYEKVLAKYDAAGAYSDIEISFYPYININHTIRVRNGRVKVRIWEEFKIAPTEIHRALADILVAKLLRKPAPAVQRRTYTKYINSTEIQEIARANKKRKGRKLITSPIGSVYNLETIFDKLNLIYFSGELSKPTLSWSNRKTFRRLGHFDSTHEVIVISKSLDRRSVPKFVVEYVVYHEMLHIYHPTIYKNGRKYNHTPAFKKDEKKFFYFDEAEEWIDDNLTKIKRSVGRRR